MQSFDLENPRHQNRRNVVKVNLTSVNSINKPIFVHMKKQVMMTGVMLFAMGAVFAQYNEATVYEAGVGSNEAVVEQIGFSNLVVLNQQADYSAMPSNYADIYQDGDYNDAYVNQTAYWGHKSYVEQVGNNNLVNVDIWRNGNESRAFQYGDWNISDQDIKGGGTNGSKALIDQTGTYNIAKQQMGITGDLIAQYNYLKAYQDGYSNYSYQEIVTDVHFSAEGNLSKVDQFGDDNDSWVYIGSETMVPDDNEANANQYGDYNWSKIVVLGSDNWADVSQTGDLNDSYVKQEGNNNDAVVKSVGDYNNSNVLQIGNGNYGDIFQTGMYNDADLDQIGSNNDATIIQTD